MLSLASQKSDTEEGFLFLIQLFLAGLAIDIIVLFAPALNIT